MKGYNEQTYFQELRMVPCSLSEMLNSTSVTLASVITFTNTFHSFLYIINHGTSCIIQKNDT